MHTSASIFLSPKHLRSCEEGLWHRTTAHREGSIKWPGCRQEESLRRQQDPTSSFHCNEHICTSFQARPMQETAHRGPQISRFNCPAVCTSHAFRHVKSDVSDAQTRSRAQLTSSHFMSEVGHQEASYGIACLPTALSDDSHHALQHLPLNLGWLWPTGHVAATSQSRSARHTVHKRKHQKQATRYTWMDASLKNSPRLGHRMCPVGAGTHAASALLGEAQLPVDVAVGDEGALVEALPCKCRQRDEAAADRVSAIDVTQSKVEIGAKPDSPMIQYPSNSVKPAMLEMHLPS